MEGLAEVGPGPQDLIDPLMLDVFSPIVVGDGASQLGRMPTQPSVERFTDLSAGVLGQLGQMNKSTGAFQAHPDGLFALSRDDGVGLPVSRLSALENIGWPKSNGNPARNMALTMFAAMTTPQTLAMSTR